MERAVVVEQIICACHLILSTVPIHLGYRGIVTCMELNMNGLLVVLQMVMPLVLYAMCRSTRETQLMLPAKTSCPEFWTREYYGYLMSGRILNVGRLSFVCVDGAYEPVPGSQGNRAAGHFYHVEAVCGTMQCPPYVNYKELTCAVCTK